MNFKIDFVRHRKIFFTISIIILLAGIVSLFVQGLNLGIDFVSGSRLDYTLNQKVDSDKAKAIFEGLGYQKPNLRVGGTNQDVLIFRTDTTLNKAEKEKIVNELNKAFSTKVSVQEQIVDPIIGRELARNAIIGILLACVIIGLYVAIRFEYRFAIATILSLLHDAVIIVGAFSIFQLEVDLFFIAAVLTIIGYSMNDTIVVFDRIRENYDKIKPTKWDDLADMVNMSIQQTLVRSLNTVITVVIAAVCLLFMGGEGIRNFSIALLVGLIFGAYSSIFIASQIWVVWKWKGIKKGEGKESLATAE